MARETVFKRKTSESDISLALNIDGCGDSTIMMPVGFFSHLLANFSRHGSIDLTFTASGDIEVDQHHLIEDSGLCLGEAFKRILADKKGIARAGFFVYPMDEALAVVAVDFGGRPYLQFDAEFRRRFCGDFDTDLVPDFFMAFASAAAANVVVRMPYGRSDHHKLEATFKAFGKALKMACTTGKDLADVIPSTKGVI